MWVRGREYTLVAAINEATAEVKYFVTNTTTTPPARLLAVGFRRATIEHSFRIAKSEAGLAHYEGRQYVGLVRHLVMALVALGFVAEHTERLRGEKPAGDGGAGVPGVESLVPGGVATPPESSASTPCRRRDPLPPASERAGHAVPQETAA